VSDRIVEEQAALRRVATLVARAAAPEQVFAAVTEEVGRLLSVDYTLLSRYDPDRAATAVGAWSRTGGAVPAPVGTRIPLGGGIHTLVLAQLRGMAPPPGSEEFKAQLDEVAVELTETIDEVRELARGIHPSVLAKGGLRPALTTLARRSVVAAELDVRVERRLPAQAEIAAYYVVSEALTNAAKHAHASAVQVEVCTGEAEGGAVLRVRVRDDGGGGVDLSRGSGLLGLKDRVEALGGTMSIESSAGHGTKLHVTLPITAT
jgi:signal transduction histidine kinase